MSLSREDDDEISHVDTGSLDDSRLADLIRDDLTLEFSPFENLFDPKDPDTCLLPETKAENGDVHIFDSKIPTIQYEREPQVEQGLKNDLDAVWQAHSKEDNLDITELASQNEQDQIVENILAELYQVETGYGDIDSHRFDARECFSSPCSALGDSVFEDRDHSDDSLDNETNNSLPSENANLDESIRDLEVCFAEPTEGENFSNQAYESSRVSLHFLANTTKEGPSFGSAHPMHGKYTPILPKEHIGESTSAYQRPKRGKGTGKKRGAYRAQFRESFTNTHNDSSPSTSKTYSVSGRELPPFVERAIPISLNPDPLTNACPGEYPGYT